MKFLCNALLLLLHAATTTNAQLIGIDTGSQYFKVALVKPGSPFQIVTNVHSKRKTATILGFDEAERRFGGDAVTLASRRPTQAISFDLVRRDGLAPLNRLSLPDRW